MTDPHSTTAATDVKDARKGRLYGLACLLLLALNVGFQWYQHREHLHDEVAIAGRPDDGPEYLEKAQAIAAGNFAEALRDGYRMPGYPLFLAAFHLVSDQPLLAARYAQILLSALAVLFAYLTLVNMLGSRAFALLGAAIVAAWYPLYYFSANLFAESASIALLSLLLFVLSRAGDAASGRTLWLYLPALTAALIYLKPNHLFLVLPVLAFLLFLPDRRKLRAAWYPAATLALLLPWQAFLYAESGRFIPLSTTSGLNLYAGTGMLLYPQESNTLFFRFAQMTGKFAVSDSGVYHLAPETYTTLPQVDAYYSARAGAIWKERPLATAFYGLGKVLHGFGFSLRGARDAVSAAMFLLSAACAVFLWRDARLRRWAALYGGCLIVTAAQFFIYLPLHRLRVVMFDIPALLVIAATLFLLAKRAGWGALRRRAANGPSTA